MMCQSCPGLDTPATSPETKLVPINQIAGVPSLFCHRMSDLPSPLKSPLPLTCQLGPGLTGLTTFPESRLLPSISQIAGVPSLFCHRMSDLPSPLKSPLPLICQLG